MRIAFFCFRGPDPPDVTAMRVANAIRFTMIDVIVGLVVTPFHRLARGVR
jgi:hypothetical protein